MSSWTSTTWYKDCWKVRDKKRAYVKRKCEVVLGNIIFSLVYSWSKVFSVIPSENRSMRSRAAYIEYIYYFFPAKGLNRARSTLWHSISVHITSLRKVFLESLRLSKVHFNSWSVEYYRERKAVHTHIYYIYIEKEKDIDLFQLLQSS